HHGDRAARVGGRPRGDRGHRRGERRRHGADRHQRFPRRPRPPRRVRPPESARSLRAHHCRLPQARQALRRRRTELAAGSRAAVRGDGCAFRFHRDGSGVSSGRVHGTCQAGKEPQAMRTLLLALLLCVTSAFAQYPNKPIRMIVPLVPGGNQDIVARAVAEEVSKNLGQPVVVENRPGQSAIIGTQFVKNSQPDGYTLLSVAVTFARVPAVVKAAGYNAVTDFTGVSLVCRIPQVLVVHPAFPAKSVQELIAAAKARPGEVSFGSSGNGSTGHVAAEMFMRMTGTRLLHVAYKGNAQALVDVMGGQINMMFDQVSTSGPQVKGGKVR